MKNQQLAGSQRVVLHSFFALLLLPFLLLPLSCRPSSYEQFVRADQTEDGRYVFALDLSDSAATYDISLYTRVDAPLLQAERPAGQLGLEVEWTLPDLSQGDTPPEWPATREFTPRLTETVYLPYGTRAGSSQLYRSGIKPEPAGEWLLAVRPIDAPEGLRGIGIICKRRD